MFDKVNASFDFHQQALSLRNKRQEILSANIANTDTPNYKARDIDFASQLAAAVQNSSAGRLNTSSSAHLTSSRQSSTGPDSPDLLYRRQEQPTDDGNTVDMDIERAQFLENSVRYQASLVMINSYISGLKSAIRPE